MGYGLGWVWQDIPLVYNASYHLSGRNKFIIEQIARLFGAGHFEKFDYMRSNLELGKRHVSKIGT